MIRRSARPARAGFTLVEILMSIGILGVVMLMVGRAFDMMQTSIRQGVALAEITTTHRTMFTQLARDFDHMIPAESGGFLAIATRTIKNRYVIAENQRTNAQFNLESDQLMFIRARGDLEPVCPTQVGGATTSYVPSYKIIAPDVRVWYGHIALLTPDGLDAGDLETQTPVNPTDLPGPNYFASNWVLGRQALFLMDNATIATLGLNIYGSGAKVTDTVAGYSSGAPTNPPAGLPVTIRSGLTDIAGESLDAINTALRSNPAAIGNYLFCGDGTAASTRLRGNTVMKYYVDPSTPTNSRFLSTWQLAQMHPVFAENVSDFTVEFAGDFDNDGMIDTYKTTEIAYSPAADPKMRDVGRYKGSIRWYGGDEDRTGVGVPSGDTPLGANAAKGFYISTSGGYKIYYWSAYHPELWPKLIRIRYRLHDHRGKLTNPDDITPQVSGPRATKPGQVFEQIIRVRR